MFLKKTAEEGRIREIQIVCDLLYGHLRGFQLGFCIEDYRFVDPLGHGTVTHLLHDRRKIFVRHNVRA